MTSLIFARLRPLILPAMATFLAIYVALHSPLREAIATALGFKSRGCFFCAGSLQLNLIADSLCGVLLIAIAMLAARVIAGYSDGPSYERPLVFGLCALAFIVIPAAVIGGIGEFMGSAFLRPPVGPLLAAFPGVISILFARRQRGRARRPYVESVRPNRLVLMLGTLGGIVLMTSAIIGLTHPPTGFDALGYHAPLAVFLWRDGNLGAFLNRALGDWPLANPGTAELWFGLLQLAGGEYLANLGQLPFALFGSAGVYAFTRRSGMSAGPSLLAASAFLLMPMVVLQSGMQLNDVVGASLLIAILALASAPVRVWNLGRLVLIGVGLGLVATTKLVLLPGVAAVGLFVIGAILWQGPRCRAVRSVLKPSLLVALCFLVVVVPWWLRNVARYGNPLYPSALPLLGRGVFDSSKADAAFVPSPALWPLYPLLEKHDEQSGLGLLFILSVIPGSMLAALRGRRQPLLLYMFVWAVMLPTWWILTQHFPRYLLGLAGLGFAFLPWSLLAVPRRARQMATALIAVSAVFSVLVTFDEALLPFARQPNTRAEFYDRVWGVDPVALSLPENEGLLLNTGYAPTIPEYTAYYPLLGASLSRTVIPVDRDATTASIVTRMQRAGIRYAYVAASPENRAVIEALFDPSYFELVETSTITVGERNGARHFLYQRSNEGEAETGTRRYLYRLKS